MAEFKKRYNPNRSADWNYGGKRWRLSRSKIDLFLECPRCFYLDNKLGTARPRGPAFTLNVAVDALFKKEFDVHREAGSKHPIMEQYGVNATPFVHPEMDTWRENFEGIEYHHKDTGMTISGAVDDIWEGDDGKLIVVDYKATAKDTKIESMNDISWREQYTRQMSVYQWLLRQNGFNVSDTGYFVYANASAAEDAFDDVLTFETTLVPCEADDSWIEPLLPRIHECLQGDTIPEIGDECEFCPYRDAAGKKLQALHKKNHS